MAEVDTGEVNYMSPPNHQWADHAIPEESSKRDAQQRRAYVAPRASRRERVGHDRKPRAVRTA